MGYIAVLVVMVIVVPVLFMLFSKRPVAHGETKRKDHGVTHTQPASDQPTPRSGAVNQISSGATKKIPPG
jgi:hypothetical protein